MSIMLSTPLALMRSPTMFMMDVGPWYGLRRLPSTPSTPCSGSPLRVPMTRSGRVWGTASYIAPIRQKRSTFR